MKIARVILHTTNIDLNCANILYKHHFSTTVAACVDGHDHNADTIIVDVDSFHSLRLDSADACIKAIMLEIKDADAIFVYTGSLHKGIYMLLETIADSGKESELFSLDFNLTVRPAVVMKQAYTLDLTKEDDQYKWSLPTFLSSKHLNFLYTISLNAFGTILLPYYENIHIKGNKNIAGHDSITEYLCSLFNVTEEDYPLLTNDSRPKLRVL